MDDDQGRHALGYDDRYQLTGATHPLDPAESFTYDAAGNRLSSHLSATYRYNAANQLIDDAEFTYAFDADGNCTGKISKLNGERHEYIFNSENRMTGYRKYDLSGTTLVPADYFYDAIGRRMAKSVDGVLTRYLYQDEDIWMELAPDGQIQRTYVHGPGIDEPLATWGADNRIYYYVTDALGTVRHIRDDNPSAFNLVATFNYDSFGQLLPSSSTGWSDAYRYTSREWDPESGTYFFRVRHYDPHSGRFLSIDPIGDASGYAYGLNNPIVMVDPSGAVTYSVQGAYVKLQNASDVVRRCGGRNPRACTLYQEKTTCSCSPCAGGSRGVAAHITITLTYQIIYLNLVTPNLFGGTTSPGQREEHEHEHLVDSYDKLWKAIGIAQVVEAQTYPSSKACQEACSDYEDEFHNIFAKSLWERIAH